MNLAWPRKNVACELPMLSNRLELSALNSHTTSPLSGLPRRLVASTVTSCSGWPAAVADGAPAGLRGAVVARVSDAPPANSPPRPAAPGRTAGNFASPYGASLYSAAPNVAAPVAVRYPVATPPRAPVTV